MLRSQRWEGLKRIPSMEDLSFRASGIPMETDDVMMRTTRYTRSLSWIEGNADNQDWAN